MKSEEPKTNGPNTIQQDATWIDENGNLRVKESGAFGYTISTVRSIGTMPNGEICFL